MKWWLISVAAAGAALAVAYRLEDPFLKHRWPSPRERAAQDRLLALRTDYGWQATQPWS